METKEGKEIMGEHTLSGAEIFFMTWASVIVGFAIFSILCQLCKRCKWCNVD